MSAKMSKIITSVAVSALFAGAAHAQSVTIYTQSGQAITVDDNAVSAVSDSSGVNTEVDGVAEEVTEVEEARAATVAPVVNLTAPNFRYADEDAVTGGAADVYNVTNIENYETSVAGDVYAPVLSTENVNKLYVDNSIEYIENIFNIQLNTVQQDIQQITQILEGVCMDLSVLDQAYDWQHNGSSYSFRAALGENCGVNWTFEKTEDEKIEDYAYNHGCEDANDGKNASPRHNSEHKGHHSWGFSHHNAHDRGIHYKKHGWKDDNNDGRDDATYASYVKGYNSGYNTCGGTGTVVEETTTTTPTEPTTVETTVRTETPILLTREKYDPARSFKRSGNYSLHYRNNYDWYPNDYAYYANVATTNTGVSVDARITLLQNGYNIPVSMSRDSAERNVIQLVGNSYLDGAMAWFKIEFIDSSTGDPLFIETNLTTGDLDGEYTNKEDVVYRQSDIIDYSRTSDTNVEVRTNNGYIIASGGALNNPAARGEAESGNQRHWFSVRFQGSSIEFGLSPRNTTSGFGFNGAVVSEDVIIETVNP